MKIVATLCTTIKLIELVPNHTTDMCTKKSENLLNSKLLFGEPQAASWYVSKALKQIVARSAKVTLVEAARELNFKI